MGNQAEEMQGEKAGEERRNAGPAKEKATRTLTVFGTETEFEGILEFTDDLVIAGKFHGKITATGNLEIARTAHCAVEKISAHSIIISGSVTGDIEAENSVELCKGGALTGNITTPRIRIDSHTEFDGQITMLEKMPETNLFASSSKEYKEAMVLHSNVIE